MAKSKDNRWAIVSLITGILAFVLPCMGLLLAVIAIITGYVGQQRQKNRWMAIVGMVLGAIVIALYIIGAITGALKNLLGIFGL